VGLREAQTSLTAMSQMDHDTKNVRSEPKRHYVRGSPAEAMTETGSNCRVTTALLQLPPYRVLFNLASASNNDVADCLPTLGQLSIWSRVTPSKSVR
jgi:hypothetical protein